MPAVVPVLHLWCNRGNSGHYTNMLKRFIHTFMLRRHFWRHATLSEVAELYASRVLRLLAITLASALISIYLYQTGYSLSFIGYFWAIYYAFASIAALPLAALVAWVGPKHSILWSNILFIPAMIAFALLPQFGTWLLVPIIILQASSAVLYMIAYTTDFSKVKSVEHAGKELAFMNILEKITMGLSPLVGGLLAFLLGPQLVLIIAAFVFLLAAIPLLQTEEPMKRHQKLRFAAFPWHLLRDTALAKFAIGYDVMSSGVLWSLFVAITIIGIESTNEVYAINGLLLSVVVFAAVGASYVYGKLIDNRKGWELLQVAIIVNSLTHLTRPFLTSTVGAAGLNAVNEAATSGYLLTYRRGVFDNADRSGQRILYIGLSEVISCAGASVSALLLAVAASLFTEQTSFHIAFFATAAVVLLILTARFPMFKRSS